MIKRIWNGYTTPENADAYERLLDSFVFPGIEAKKIPGYRSIELLRRVAGDEVQFTTVMSFDSLDNVIAFQGAGHGIIEDLLAAEKAAEEAFADASHTADRRRIIRYDDSSLAHFSQRLNHRQQRFAVEQHGVGVTRELGVARQFFERGGAARHRPVSAVDGAECAA